MNTIKLKFKWYFLNNSISRTSYWINNQKVMQNRGYKMFTRAKFTKGEKMNTYLKDMLYPLKLCSTISDVKSSHCNKNWQQIKDIDYYYAIWK
jgi:hypothetical protein